MPWTLPTPISSHNSQRLALQVPGSTTEASAETRIKGPAGWCDPLFGKPLPARTAPIHASRPHVPCRGDDSAYRVVLRFLRFAPVRPPTAVKSESTNVKRPRANGSLLLFMDPTVVLLLVFNSNNRKMSQRLHALAFLPAKWLHCGSNTGPSDS